MFSQREINIACKLPLSERHKNSDLLHNKLKDDNYESEEKSILELETISR